MFDKYIQRLLSMWGEVVQEHTVCGGDVIMCSA